MNDENFQICDACTFALERAWLLDCSVAINSQKGKVRCETAVGTPDYISPEVSDQVFELDKFAVSNECIVDEGHRLCIYREAPHVDWQ